MGSDEATSLITQQPLMFGETALPAGAYTLYLVPNEDGTAKLAFSSGLGGWGSAGEREGRRYPRGRR